MAKRPVRPKKKIYTSTQRTLEGLTPSQRKKAKSTSPRMYNPGLHQLRFTYHILEWDYVKGKYYNKKTKRFVSERNANRLGNYFSKYGFTKSFSQAYGLHKQISKGKKRTREAMTPKGKKRLRVSKPKPIRKVKRYLPPKPMESTATEEYTWAKMNSRENSLAFEMTVKVPARYNLTCKDEGDAEKVKVAFQRFLMDVAYEKGRLFMDRFKNLPMERWELAGKVGMTIRGWITPKRDEPSTPEEIKTGLIHNPKIGKATPALRPENYNDVVSEIIQDMSYTARRLIKKILLASSPGFESITITKVTFIFMTRFIPSAQEKALARRYRGGQRPLHY